MWFLASAFLAAPASATPKAPVSATKPAEPAPKAPGSSPKAAAPAPKTPVPAQPPEEQQSEQARLDRAVRLYVDGQYAECAQAFNSLLDKSHPNALNDPGLVEKGRIYQVACLLVIDQKPRAEAVAQAAVESNPTMPLPDSLIFQRDVIDLFDRVIQQNKERIRKQEDEQVRAAQQRAERERAVSEAERKRVQQLLDLASTETVVVRNSRWIALVPFGVGQFQNRDQAFGWLFLISEAALATTAVTSVIAQSQLESQVKCDGVSACRLAPEGKQALRNWHTAFVISSWGFIGVTALGILQAQLAFEPEFRSSQHRELPTDLKSPKPRASLVLAPAFSADNRGFQLGLTGLF
jgi:hypothetical protein